MLFDSVTTVLKIYPLPSIMKLMHKQYMSPIGIPFYFRDVVLLEKICFKKIWGKKDDCKFIYFRYNNTYVIVKKYILVWKKLPRIKPTKSLFV